MSRKSFFKLIAYAAALSLLPAGVVSAQRMADFDIGQSNHIAPPRIIAPSSDDVDLTGKESLEFKWSPHEGDQVQRDYYDFRLYRGYDMYESGRIMKMRLPPRQWSLIIKSEAFEDGQIYTWSIRQVYTGSAKSRRSFESFRVIKRSAKGAGDAGN